MPITSFFKGLYNRLVNEEKRNALSAKYSNVSKIVSSKRLWLFIMMTYGGLSLFTLKKHNEQYSLKLSVSRKVSRVSGKFAHLKVPQPLRKPLYTFYSKVYNVKLDEIEDEIESFESFNKFFTRTIKPRPIDPQPFSLASPADSRVLTFSEVKGDDVLIVKGIEYRLGEFLTGINSYKIKDEVLESMKRNPANKLYQIILYLAPGDYHRFHSPADCQFKTRNHIIGKLLPVKEKYVKTHSNVYEKNERVSLFGDWVQGLMCMVFVGALNVGSIDLNFDSELQTNRKLKMPFTNTDIKVYTENGQDGEESAESKGLLSGKNTAKGIPITKGQEIGKFNLGSTVVLVFEASPDFEFTVQPGEAVRYGQCIGLSKKTN